MAFDLSPEPRDELRQALGAGRAGVFSLESSRDAVYISPRNCCFYSTRVDVLARFVLPVKQAEVDEKHALLAACRHEVGLHCKCRVDLLLSDKPLAAFLLAGTPVEVEHAIDALTWLFSTPDTGFSLYSGDASLLLMLLAQEIRRCYRHRYAMYAWKQFSPVNLPQPTQSAGDSPEFTPRASRTAINSSLTVLNRTPPSSSRGLDPFAAFKSRPRPETPRLDVRESKEDLSSSLTSSLSSSTQDDSMAFDSEPDSDPRLANEDADDYGQTNGATEYKPADQAVARRGSYRRREFELLSDSLGAAVAGTKRMRRTVEKVPVY